MKGSGLSVSKMEILIGSRTPLSVAMLIRFKAEKRSFLLNLNNMRIAEIDVPKGCTKIFLDLENGMLTVSYGSGINGREFFNQYTKQFEELPYMGDLSVMWNEGKRECAIIGTIDRYEGVNFRANNGSVYMNAVKFRDLQQYLDIRGIYGED